MFATLFFLAAQLTHGHAYDRVVGVANVATWLASRRDPAVYFPALAREDADAARAKVGKLFVVWSFYESSFLPDVAGDSGASCGIMQVVPSHVGKTCGELRRSAYVGMEAGAVVLERLIVECGSLPRALGAYAGGHCGDAPDLVERHCALIGGC